MSVFYCPLLVNVDVLGFTLTLLIEVLSYFCRLRFLAMCVVSEMYFQHGMNNVKL